MPRGQKTDRRRSKADSDNSATVDPGTGNVFADLGLSKPELAVAKAELVQRIRGLIEDRELTHAKAAKILGIDEPSVTLLLKGSVGGYSIDRLFRLLIALGQRIEITVGPTADGTAGSVVVTSLRSAD